jgi:hypothetical protein
MSPRRPALRKSSPAPRKTKPSEPPPKTAAAGHARCVVLDVAAVDFSVSDKWKRRLKRLDDYQRSAPFVLGRFTLG